MASILYMYVCMRVYKRIDIIMNGVSDTKVGTMMCVCIVQNKMRRTY